MQRMRLNHIAAQTLSPQQIQLIKLLQVPSVAIKERVEQELADNPALAEAEEDTEDEVLEDFNATDEYTHKETYSSKGLSDQEYKDQQQKREGAQPTMQSLEDWLLEQLGFLQLDPRQHKIGVHLIGSIESDGYIRRPIEAIVNDLSFTQYIEADAEEVVEILSKIQQFDPVGIGARDLRECLLIQLERRKEDSPKKSLATQIVTHCFDAFAKKHYEKIAKRLRIQEQQLLKDALALIGKLNPKPGGISPEYYQNQALYPDFIVAQQDGQLHVSLTTYSAPKVGVRKSYLNMLQEYKACKKLDKSQRLAASFVKTKLRNAQWFVDALNQRQITLLSTMQAIVKLQRDFFLEAEEQQLKPMLLKHVAQEIKMDVSTVSRIVNNKSVQTDFGIYPLKFFFTEGISTTSGEEVSSRAIKQIIQEIIATEDKRSPYSDDKIAAMLKEQGNNVARRTVTKYREQLHLPVARLRKEL